MIECHDALKKVASTINDCNTINEQKVFFISGMQMSYCRLQSTEILHFQSKVQ